MQAERCCKWEQNDPREMQPKAEGVSLVENGRRMSEKEEELGNEEIL